MFQETYRIYTDVYCYNPTKAGIACQVISDNPELTIEFVRSIPGVVFTSTHVSYTRWMGEEVGVVSFSVTKGLEFIVRTIPPYTERLGTRWPYWRTLDRFKKKCK